MLWAEPIMLVYKRKPPDHKIRGLQYNSRRRPTLPASYPTSTIGAGGLNCRVRNGNGCGPSAMAARKYVNHAVPSHLYRAVENDPVHNEVIGVKKPHGRLVLLG